MRAINNRGRRFFNQESLRCESLEVDVEREREESAGQYSDAWAPLRAALAELSSRVARRVALEEKFRRLVVEWKARKSHSSCIEDMALHIAYQRIIGMGPEAVPLILAELEKEPDHWFWALYAITEADPVPEEDRGNLRKMAAAWIRWGKENWHQW